MGGIGEHTGGGRACGARWRAGGEIQQRRDLAMTEHAGLRRREEKAVLRGRVDRSSATQGCGSGAGSLRTQMGPARRMGVSEETVSPQ